MAGLNVQQVEYRTPRSVSKGGSSDPLCPESPRGGLSHRPSAIRFMAAADVEYTGPAHQSHSKNLVWSGSMQTQLDEEVTLKRENKAFLSLLLALEVFIIVIYAIWIDYTSDDATAEEDVPVWQYFRDISVMIFVGFGFLMTFLRRYGFSAVGYTLLCAALICQLSVIVRAFFARLDEGGKISEEQFVSVETLLDSLFCSAALMITFGAVLGKATPLQMVLITVFECFFYFLNVYICLYTLKAIDIGGGMIIHMFGAYFGLAVTYWLSNERTRGHKDAVSIYSSDLFSFIGTIFLWVMWPSFCAVLAHPAVARARALINTYLSLCGSTVATFIFSRMLGKCRFEAVDVQNATLAGGVVMGVAAHLNISPAGAVAAGLCAGMISVVGYHYVTPFLQEKFNIQDTCGVNNLHGMPGILGAIVGIWEVCRAYNNEGDYNSMTAEGVREFDIIFPEGDHRGRTVAALFITLGLSISSGWLTGFVLTRLDLLDSLLGKNYFHDGAYWHLPEEEVPLVKGGEAKGPPAEKKPKPSPVPALALGQTKGSEPDEDYQAEELQDLSQLVDAPVHMDDTIRLWKAENVGEFLEHIGLGQYRRVFTENEIGGAELLAIDRDLLNKMVPTVGHVVRILTQLEALRSGKELVDQVIPPPAPQTVEQWSTVEVSSWLEHLGLAKYAGAFRENFIGGQELLEMDQEILRSLVAPVGHVLKIRANIDELRRGVGLPTMADATIPRTPSFRTPRPTDSQVSPVPSKPDDEDV